MTDRENSSKGFLNRWSRKKIESDRPNSAAKPQASDAPPEAPGSPPGCAEMDAKTPAQVTVKPEFDLASLPPLDSITAATDIRAFLAPGVPKELARAALRRVWRADPAIRDFKGLAENDWDFTDPMAMPGFGALPEGYDVKKMMAHIFGDDAKPATPEDAPEPPPVPQLSNILDKSASPESLEEAVPANAEEVSPPQISSGGIQVAEAVIVQCDDSAASQNSISGIEAEERRPRRQHGTASPR